MTYNESNNFSAAVCRSTFEPRFLTFEWRRRNKQVNTFALLKLTLTLTCPEKQCAGHKQLTEGRKGKRARDRKRERKKERKGEEKRKKGSSRCRYRKEEERKRTS